MPYRLSDLYKEGQPKLGLNDLYYVATKNLAKEIKEYESKATTFSEMLDLIKKNVNLIDVINSDGSGEIQKPINISIKDKIMNGDVETTMDSSFRFDVETVEFKNTTIFNENKENSSYITYNNGDLILNCLNIDNGDLISSNIKLNSNEIDMFVENLVETIIFNISNGINFGYNKDNVFTGIKITKDGFNYFIVFNTDLDMSNKNIINLSDGVNPLDAVNKQQLEKNIVQHNDNLLSHPYLTTRIEEVISGVVEVAKALEAKNFNETEGTIKDVFDNLKFKITEINGEISLLKGCSINLGKIDLITSEITQEKLTDFALSKFTELQKGLLIYDLNGQEWEYNGLEWIDNGVKFSPAASNSVLGVVKGNNYVDISNGLMKILQSDNSSKLDGKVSSYFASKDYTDSEIANILTDSKGYSDGILVTAKGYTDVKTNDTLTLSKAYTDTTAANTLISSNGYTDEEIVKVKTYSKDYSDSVLVVAKGYTDDEIILSKHYTDSQVSATTDYLKTYSDTSSLNALNSSKTYTDEEIVLKEGELKTYIDNSSATTLAESKSYTDSKINLVYTKIEIDGKINTIEVEMSDIRNIAEGKTNAYVFATVAAMNLWLSDPINVQKLKIGDNFYIEEEGVTDFWWNGTEAKPSEVAKVDLTDYVTKIMLEQHDNSPTAHNLTMETQTASDTELLGNSYVFAILNNIYSRIKSLLNRFNTTNGHSHNGVDSAKVIYNNVNGLDLQLDKKISVSGGNIGNTVTFIDENISTEVIPVSNSITNKLFGWIKKSIINRFNLLKKEVLSSAVPIDITSDIFTHGKRIFTLPSSSVDLLVEMVDERSSYGVIELNFQTSSNAELNFTINSIPFIIYPRLEKISSSLGVKTGMLKIYLDESNYPFAVQSTLLIANEIRLGEYNLDISNTTIRSNELVTVIFKRNFTEKQTSIQFIVNNNNFSIVSISNPNFNYIINNSIFNLVLVGNLLPPNQGFFQLISPSISFNVNDELGSGTSFYAPVAKGTNTQWLSGNIDNSISYPSWRDIKTSLDFVSVPSEKDLVSEKAIVDEFVITNQKIDDVITEVSTINEKVGNSLSNKVYLVDSEIKQNITAALLSGIRTFSFIDSENTNLIIDNSFDPAKISCVICLENQLSYQQLTVTINGEQVTLGAVIGGDKTSSTLIFLDSSHSINVLSPKVFSVNGLINDVVLDAYNLNYSGVVSIGNVITSLKSDKLEKNGDASNVTSNFSTTTLPINGSRLSSWLGWVRNILTTGLDSQILSGNISLGNASWKTILNSIRTVANSSNNQIVSEMAIAKSLESIVINSTVQPTATIYLATGNGTSNGTFNAKQPTIAQTYPTVVTNAMSLKNTFTYQLSSAGIISSLSSWDLNLILTNLDQLTTYTINADLILSQSGVETTLSNLVGYRFTTATRQTNANVTIPFSNNLPRNIEYVANSNLILRLSWSHNTGITTTIRITSSLQLPSSLRRNGGSIGATEVSYNDGVDVVTQSEFNDNINTRVNTLNVQTTGLEVNKQNVMTTSIIAGSDAIVNLQNNTNYKCSDTINSLTLLGNAEYSGTIQFTAGLNNIPITIPIDFRFDGNEIPNTVQGNTYLIVFANSLLMINRGIRF